MTGFIAGERLVAVGDSITEGYDSSNFSTTAWPPQLWAMLGSNDAAYEVFNYGVSGRTMMKVNRIFRIPIFLFLSCHHHYIFYIY